MAPIISSVKTCALGRQRPLSPQCPCRGRLFVCCCGRCSCVHLRGEPTLFPGWRANKSYVIATSDLWLFIHASNLFPSLPTPLHCKSPTRVMNVLSCCVGWQSRRRSASMTAAEGVLSPGGAGSGLERPASRWWWWWMWCLMSSDVSWHIRDKLRPMH